MTRQELIERVAQAIAEKEGFYLTEAQAKRRRIRYPSRAQRNANPGNVRAWRDARGKRYPTDGGYVDFLAWASARAATQVFSLYGRDGRRKRILDIPPGGRLDQPALSPDGRRLLFQRVVQGDSDIQVHDLQTGLTRPATVGPDFEELGNWTPDCRAIIYSGSAAASPVLFKLPFDTGAQPAEIGRNWVPDVAIQSDATLALRALHQALAERGMARDDARVAEIEQRRAAAIEDARADAMNTDGTPVKGKRIVSEINRVFGDNTVIVKENLYRWINWEIVAKSHDFKKQDARTIHFPLKVAADGESVLRYTVKYTW